MKLILPIILAVFFLSACTGTRYGHYNYVRKSKTHQQVNSLSDEKVTTKAEHINIAQKNIELTISKGTDEMGISVLTKQTTWKTPGHRLRNSNGKVGKPFHPEKQIQKPITRELNRNAKRSLLTALAGLLVSIIPFLGWVIGFIMFIRAINLGLKAIKEIDMEPYKYYGMGKAMAGVCIGALAIAAVAFLLFLGIGALLSGINGYTFIWFG